MQFASLGSGSRGNATLVQAGATCVMIDCGFSVREVERRLARIGQSAQHIAAILVTHEHGDHVGGVAPLARKYRLPVYLTAGTLSQQPDLRDCDTRVICSHGALALGDLEVQPFPVPHDAREPCQFVLSDGVVRLGILTDTGCTTAHIETMLSGCEALMLECNHDPDMLAAGTYPAAVKQRVAGSLGHLSNQQAAALLARLDAGALQHLVAAHLSAKHNTPRLARASLSAVLGRAPEWVAVADQEDGLAWCSIAPRVAWV